MNESHGTKGRPRARVAVLIDADNASPAYRHEVEAATKRYGEIVKCLAFGVRSNRRWKADGALATLEWFGDTSLTTGKNASDIALSAMAAKLAGTAEIDVFFHRVG